MPLTASDHAQTDRSRRRGRSSAALTAASRVVRGLPARVISVHVGFDGRARILLTDGEPEAINRHLDRYPRIEAADDPNVAWWVWDIRGHELRLRIQPQQVAA